MAEPKHISPLLDDIMIGDAISDHNGIRCYPAMNTKTNGKFILKIISVPSSATKLDALLLTGALENEEAAKAYFSERAKELTDEIDVLQQLSRQEGFLPCTGYQIVPMEQTIGFDIYILSEYRVTLDRYMAKHPITQLDALNLGLDLCSALTACRRSGYLYANLKPSNIYLNSNDEFRIADPGLISRKTLKYATIPEHYLSAYTAPEIADPFSPLNETIDVYAIGMILYEIYNNGVLPENKNEVLPSPEYADAELAEIIGKACSVDAADRWQDPAQMGQMLVAYMQKNGAHDTPVVPTAPEPAPAPEPEPEPEQTEFTDNSNYENISIDEMIEIIDSIDTQSSEQEESHSDERIEDTAITEQVVITPTETVENEHSSEKTAVAAECDALEASANEDICTEQPLEETNAEEISELPEYEGLSDDVGQILSQADLLAEAEVPQPVVILEPENERIPKPEEEPHSNDSPTPDTEEETDMKTDNYYDEALLEEAPKQSSHWIRNTVIILLSLLILGGGILFYTLYVSKNITQLQVTGAGDSLSVAITSNADESLLSVSCYNTETQVIITVPVSNGKAEFTGLNASSKYTITVNIAGLHVLTGSTETEYTTPAETTIVQYDVEIGETPGTVKIKFAVNGPDSEKWSFTYSAEGQQPITQSVTGHSFTLKDLQENQKYTGILKPEKNLMIKEPLEITFTASELIRATDLQVISCYNGSLTAQWNAPDSITVDSWFARCYNDNYDQTINVKNTTATFSNLNSAEGFTVEVWAQGQSIKQTQIIGENSITVHTFSAEIKNPGTIDLNWQCDTTPQGGWIVTYYVNDSDTVFQYATTTNKAVIAPVAPGSKYNFSVSAADSSVTTFCQEQTCLVPAAETNFSLTVNQKQITKNDIQVWLCKRPAANDWIFSDVADSDYTHTFQQGDKAGFVVFLKSKFEKAEETADINIVITDEQNSLQNIVAYSASWNDIWNQNYCTLDLPVLPTEPGCYYATLYLNNMVLFETDFTIS